MSEKKAKQSRVIKMMTEEAGVEKVAKEMAESIRKMYEDRDKKALSAKQHLLDQLMVTVSKYRTANGVMSALNTVRLVYGNHGEMDMQDEIAMAKAVATKMAFVADDMANKVSELDPEELDKLCEGFYDMAFSEGDGSMIDMVEQLMILQLCQNVGPDASDVVEFLAHADQEIEKARNDLKSYCEENDLSFNELCGPHDNCYDCLCYSCTKDCKKNLQIKDGESAYAVCEDFESISFE